jgi:hypothetical protein
MFIANPKREAISLLCNPSTNLRINSFALVLSIPLRAFEHIVFKLINFTSFQINQLSCW